MSSYKQKNALNNHITNSIRIVSSDIVNQTQAQAPVDQTTEEPKRIANSNKSAKTIQTPGSFVNRGESIIENQVGKDCIAICAVGLKGFFALTEYANWVLNEGTSEDQQYLIGKLKIKGAGAQRAQMEIAEAMQLHEDANGDFNILLANIRAKDPITVTNSDVLAALQAVESDEDSALVLSALLSLSTD